MTTQASGPSSGEEGGDGEGLRDSTPSHKSLERHLLHSLVGQYEMDPAFASSVNDDLGRDSDPELDDFGLDGSSYSEDDPGAGFRALLRSFEATVKESAFDASPISLPPPVEPREESPRRPASDPADSSSEGPSVFDFTRVTRASAPSSSSLESEPNHTMTSDQVRASYFSEDDPRSPSVPSSTRAPLTDSRNPNYPDRVGVEISSESSEQVPIPAPSTFCVKKKKGENPTVEPQDSDSSRRKRKRIRIEDENEDEEYGEYSARAPDVDFEALLDSGRGGGGGGRGDEMSFSGSPFLREDDDEDEEERNLDPETRIGEEEAIDDDDDDDRVGVVGLEDGIELFRAESESGSASGSSGTGDRSHPLGPKFVSEHIAIWTKVHELMVRNGFVGLLDVLELCRRDVEKDSEGRGAESDSASVAAEFDARLAESLTGAFVGILQEYERRGEYIEQLDSSSSRTREMDMDLKTREVRETEALREEIRHLRGVNRNLYGKAKKALERSTEGMERVKTESRRTVSELRAKLKKTREELSRSRSELETAKRSRDEIRQRYRQYKRAETESLARARQVFRNAVQRGPSTVEERRELSLIRYLLDQRSTLRNQLEALHSENEQIRKQASEREGPSSPRAGYVPPPAEMRLPWMLSNSSTDSASMSSSSMFGSRSSSPTPSGGVDATRGSRSEVLHLRLSLKTLRSKFVDQRQSYERLLRQLKSQLELLEKKNRELRIEATVAKRRPLWQECVDDHHGGGDSALRPILREVMTLTKTAQMNEIVPAVQKLCDVVKPVFQMKRFCRQVCQMLEQGQSVLKFGQIVDPIPSNLAVQIRDVEDVLERWIKALQFVSSFRSLEKRCVKMLKTLPDCPVMSRSRHLSHARCERLILTGIQKLVKTTKMHREIEEAYDFVKEDPDPSSLERRLIHRFMKLFDCPRPEGVFTQMNRLWVTHNANLSVLKNLKSVVGISESSSSEQLLQKIAELHRISEIHARLEGEDSGEKE